MKIVKVLFLCIVVILISGCNKQLNNNLNDDESISNDKKWEPFYGIKAYQFDWNCDVALSEIKDIGIITNRFITNSGDLYEFSLNGVYSTTNNNCRKIDTNIKYKKIYGGILISEDNKLYSIVDGKTERPSDCTREFIEDFFDYDNNVALLKYNGESMHVVINNNKLYRILYDSVSEEYSKIELSGGIANDETYIGIYGNLIKTNKSYYEYGTITTDECTKYVDVACDVGIIKNEELTLMYDEILYTNGTYYILKSSNKIYTDIQGG